MSASEMLTARAEWDARLYDYQLARLLVDADQTFGPLNVASEAHEHERRRLTAQFGSWQRAVGEGGCDERARRTFAACQAAGKENLQLCEPMWAASRALVSVPAPDLAALRIKLDVIDKEEVWNDGNFDGDCWEIVKADAARLRRAA